MKKFNQYCLVSFLVIFGACAPNEVDSKQTESSNEDMESLSIPEGFNFETEREVTLTINDATPFVKYDVFAYSDQYGSETENTSEALNNLIYSGKPYEGNVSQLFSLSNIYDKVYIVRKDGL